MSNQQNFKIGDFVAVQYEHGDPLVGVVTKGEKAMQHLAGFSVTPEVRKKVIADPMPLIIGVRLGEYKTDAVFAEQCRKLTGKEIFKIKLEGNWRGIFS
jgi:hypothetical protein